MLERKRILQAETVNQRIVANTKLTQKVRLAALAALQHPPLVLLLRLLSDPHSGSRLVGLAAKRYPEELLRRDLRNRARQRAKEKEAEC